MNFDTVNVLGFMTQTDDSVNTLTWSQARLN